MICSKCNKEKNTTEFRVEKNGYQRKECNSCRQERVKNWDNQNKEKRLEISKKSYEKNKNKNHLKNYIREAKRKYRISEIEYSDMLSNQSNKCATCGKEEINKRLAIDHCHKSGKIRGLLCYNCNRAIGLLNDDVDVMKNIIKYLE